MAAEIGLCRAFAGAYSDGIWFNCSIDFLASAVVLIAIFLLFIGLLLLWMASRRQSTSGLPGGRIIYTDTRGWGRIEKPLYDPELKLTGKPDYLLEKGGKFIPIEVKSNQAGETAFDSHIYQLAAYCRLVEVVYGKRPEYGILRYANRTFAIDYTRELEATLMKTLTQIRQLEKLADVDRSHQSSARCLACGYRSICNQALTGGDFHTR